MKQIEIISQLVNMKRKQLIAKYQGRKLSLGEYHDIQIKLREYKTDLKTRLNNGEAYYG